MGTATIFVPCIEDMFLTQAAREVANSTPALGPEWIRHTTAASHPSHDVRVVYGKPGVPPRLDDLLRPGDDLLGFSCTSLSYRPIVPLMDEAIARGVRVVVGGAHAQLMWSAIRKRRPQVLVAAGHGDHVLGQLLDGVPPARVTGLQSGLSMQVSQGIEAPYECEPYLHETTNYTPFFEGDLQRGRRVYRDDGVDGVVMVRGITGCTKQKVCSFCSVPRVRPFDPVRRGEYLARERLDIVERFGERIYIRDCSDSLPNKECLAAMGKVLQGRSIPNRAYCGAMVWELIEPEFREPARRAGYTDFLVGLESFAVQHLHHASKPEDSIAMLLRLLDATRGQSINLFISGILGWPGETKETLRESMETIKRLVEYPQVVAISVNYLLALPRTAFYNNLVRLGALDPTDDCPDLRRAFFDHIKHFAPAVRFADLRQLVEEATSLDDRIVQYTGFLEPTAEELN